MMAHTKKPTRDDIHENDISNGMFANGVFFSSFNVNASSVCIKCIFFFYSWPPRMPKQQ